MMRELSEILKDKMVESDYIEVKKEEMLSFDEMMELLKGGN